MLLEEAALALLRASGYRTIDDPGADPSLCRLGGGIGVHGRGTSHQIDAIADFVVGQPFANAQRLLVEAKFYGQRRPVSLTVVRNSVGVLKDVSEYWVTPGNGQPATSRYHYQSAIFAATSFTEDAQRYAFAHDIYLVPLARSRHFQGVLAAIKDAVDDMSPGGDVVRTPRALGEIRAAFRQEVQNQMSDVPPDSVVGLEAVVQQVRLMGQAFVGVVARTFPLFLAPRRGLQVQDLPDVFNVRIFLPPGDAEGWTIVRNGDPEPIFTFDLPPQLFDLYAREGALTRHDAIDLKADYFSQITVVSVQENRPRLITMRLDRAWLDRLQRRR